jgi:hypothetical protein
VGTAAESNEEPAVDRVMIRAVPATAAPIGLLGSPSGAVEAALLAVGVAAALLWIGYGLAGLVPAWRDNPVARWALAFPALVLLALILMLVHIATGGAVFHSAAAVRLIVVVVAAGLLVRALRRWRRAQPSGRADLGTAVACSLLVVAVWAVPIFLALPLFSGGDVDWHVGWTEQLLNGETTPSSPLTGDVPNYYPWLFHAVLAFATCLTPGGHAALGLAPLQLLEVAGAAAALFGVGHTFAGRWCGAAVALLGSATGGFGFLVAGGFEVVRPRIEEEGGPTRFLGDLLFVRSYNPSFANLAPPYPRDVALALLIATLFLLARAVASGRARDYVPAGVTLGLVGLTQFDAFAVGLLAAVAIAATAPRGARIGASAALFVPALALFALWAAPLAVSYVRLGGFVDTTLAEPVELPAWAILGSWGIVTPLAAIGLVRVVRARGDPVARVAAASLAAAAVPLVVTALVAASLGGGFETLGRQHRYWPLLGLGLALLAGLGAHWLGALLARRSRGFAAAFAAAALAFALPSPIIAGVAIHSHFEVSAPVRQALQGDGHDALDELRAYGDGVCSALFPDPGIAFTYTGFHLVVFGNPAARENAARIRWADIYDHIVPEAQRLRDTEVVLGGRITPAELQAIVERYGLDVLVVPAGVANAGAFRSLSGRPVRFEGEPYVLFGLNPC